MRRAFTLQLFDRIEPRQTNRQTSHAERKARRAVALELCAEVLYMTPRDFQVAAHDLLASASVEDRSTFQRYFEKACQRRKLHAALMRDDAGRMLSANLVSAINSAGGLLATQQGDGTVTIRSTKKVPR